MLIVTTPSLLIYLKAIKLTVHTKKQLEIIMKISSNTVLFSPLSLLYWTQLYDCTYARGPSCFHIFLKQSTVFLYLLASNPCILVLTTSIGVLPKTDTAPAKPPNNPEEYINLQTFIRVCGHNWCMSKYASSSCIDLSIYQISLQTLPGVYDNNKCINLHLVHVSIYLYTRLIYKHCHECMMIIKKER